MDYIIEIFKNRDYELLILVLSVTVFIWLFKEFRKSYIDNKKVSKIDIGCALEKYSNLYSTIILFQSNEIDMKQLFNSFDQAISYLPERITKELLEFSKDSLNGNNFRFDNLKIMIENEIISLKDKQYSFTNRNSDESIFNQGSWFFIKYDIDALINPFIYSIFTLYGISLAYLIVVKTIDLNGYKLFAFILLIMNSLFTLMSFLYTLDLLFRKLVNKYGIKYYVLLVLVPWLITIIIPPQFSIINTITIIYFFIIASKKGFIKSKK